MNYVLRWSSNFKFGLDALASNMSLFLSSVVQYQLFWGFAIGFLVSTIAHAFIITDKPSHVPTMLLYDKGTSFQKLNQTAGATYKVSFSQFSSIVNKVKFTFTFAITLFIILVIVVLLRF